VPYLVKSRHVEATFIRFIYALELVVHGPALKAFVVARVDPQLNVELVQEGYDYLRP
jgi:hypothetical protein